MKRFNIKLTPSQLKQIIDQVGDFPNGNALLSQPHIAGPFVGQLRVALVDPETTQMIFDVLVERGYVDWIEEE